MTIELSLLKALSIRYNYNKYLKLINDCNNLSSKTLVILKEYQKYFETYSQDEKISFNKFSEFFFIIQHPNLDEKSVLFYKKLIEQLTKVDITTESCQNIIKAFEQQELYTQLHTDLDRNEDIKIILNKLEGFKERHSSYIEVQDDDMDLSKALVYTDRSKGLQWRLNCLKEYFNGGLIRGDFGIIAGFVDMGKSSFLASEVSYMAQQLKDDQYIAWFNTEGNWEQVLMRIYQATLNCTQKDLTNKTEEAIIKYTNKMKGNKNRIKVLNFQRKSIKDVENTIKNNPPSLIVFDLLDHINGFDKYLGKEGSATERYGALYQWARTISTEICPVLAVSQLNGDGNDTAYPSIVNLRGSRVDKQAAATFQLIIGGMEGNNTERFLSCPKNKISGNKGWRGRATFDPLRSRFND